MFRILICLLVLPVLLLANSINGVVKDPTGAVIVGADVTLAAPSAMAKQTTKTDAQGRFVFADMSPGAYTITVVRPGFETAQQNVQAGADPVSLTVELKIASQETAIEVTGKISSLANVDPNYVALRNALPTGSYGVKNVVIKRDVGVFTFNSGVFSFAPPVLGHVVAAVFTGDGSFELTPALPLEASYLKLMQGSESVKENFRSAVFTFTDGTFEELKSQTTSVDDRSHAESVWQSFHGRMRHSTETARSMLEYMLSENVSNIEAELLGELYNPKEAGSFSAYIHGDKHSDLRFLVRARGAMPYLPSPEEVALINVDPAGSQEGIWYLTHLAQEWKSGHASSTENRHTVRAESYRIETAIGKNDHLNAICELKLKALLPGVRVISFGLLSRLRVTRVSFADHDIAYIQENRKQDGSFYVIMPEPLVRDETYALTINYEGDKVVKKEGSGNYAVGARTSWYPSLNSFSDRALYDLTFKVPRNYTLVGVGKLVKQWREEDYAASQWTSEVPLAVAGFNYGSYKEKSVHDDTDNYDIEAYATSEVPDYLHGATQRMVLTPASMAQSALVDAENAIRLYKVWFGDAPYGRIAITQQPEFNFGQSWPTLVYLPVSAFLDSTQRWMLMGKNAFRFSEFIEEVTPHEVSHQWWGHMVGWASFHDQWLSEGFADFSAGLFLQQIEKDPSKYLQYWERARKAILDKNSYGLSANDAGPIWVGLRLDTFKTGNAYNRLVYPKGGFILHMLRSIMWDNKTGDADFIAMMHDYVATNLQKNASTETFKASVEKHMKPSMNLASTGNMDWFFTEWVYTTQVPSYRLEYSLTSEPEGKFLFTGKVTQSGVSPSFIMSVPLYFDINGKVLRAGSVALAGNQTSKEFKIRLPQKPKRVLLNANNDVLASDVQVVKTGG